MKFNEKLIELRKKHGISQEELGNKINVSRQAISKWESEQAKPEVDKIKEISKVFNVSIEYLLNDELNEDIKIENTKNNKKYIKIILIILLILLSIYLITSFYKLVVLLIYNAKANDNINKYKHYAIYYSYTMKDLLRDEIMEPNIVSYYNDGILVTVFYNNQTENIEGIGYLSDNNEYYLSYNSEIEKFVLINYEIENENPDVSYGYLTIEDITTGYYYSFENIINFAFNIKSTIQFKGASVYINIKDIQNRKVSIDKYTGLVLTDETIDTEEQFYYKQRYSYELEKKYIENYDYYINQEYLNDLEYVMAEEVYVEENY